MHVMYYQLKDSWPRIELSRIFTAVKMWKVAILFNWCLHPIHKKSIGTIRIATFHIFTAVNNRESLILGQDSLSW